MNTKEIWRPVPSQPDIIASSLGRVMIIPRFHGLHVFGGTPTHGQWDGKRFTYTRRGHKTQKVHRLVCEAFNGPPEPGQVCMHINEDARDNRPSNLAWGSQKENLNAPGFLMYCRSRTGDKHPKAKSKKQIEALAQESSAQ